MGEYLLLLTHSSEIIRFALNEMMQRNASKFAILVFYVARNMKFWSVLLENFVGCIANPLIFMKIVVLIIFLKFIYTFPNSETPSLLIYHVLVWNRNACIFLLIDPLVMPIILKTILTWTWHTKIDEL